MKSRVIEGRLLYAKSILTNRNPLLYQILNEIKNDMCNKWMKTTKKYLSEIDMNMKNLALMDRESIKINVQKWDHKVWMNDLCNKTSLKIYKLA